MSNVTQNKKMHGPDCQHDMHPPYYFKTAAFTGWYLNLTIRVSNFGSCSMLHTDANLHPKYGKK